MLERDFQAALIKRIKKRFPGCEVLKNDPENHQGIPDLIILYGNTWAMLEVKRSHSAVRTESQEYYVEIYGAMSFAGFIYPENEEEMLSDLQRSFESRRPARIPQSKQLSLDQLQRREVGNKIHQSYGSKARN